MADAQAAIQEFVALSMLRRRGELPLEDRPRIEALEEVLRELIDGARPAPRQIQNPVATAPPRPKMNVAPAKVVITPSAAPGDGPAPPPRITGAPAPPPEPIPLELDALEIQEEAPAPARSSVYSESKPTSRPPAQSKAPPEPEIDLSAKDRGKLKEVKAEDLPSSGYTPSVRPCFLEDYYTADLSLLGAAPAEAPKRVVASGGENLELMKEVRVFYGLDGAQAQPQQQPGAANRPMAPRSPPARPTGSSSTMPTARAASEPGRQPAIVHLMAGGVKRGDILPFDPGTGVVVFAQPSGEPAEALPLDEVLAIFFGLVRGAQPSVPSGQRLVVRLANDRELVGLSPDYAPGVTAMSLMPDDRRGNVDRIWIPAWAVKEIQFG